MYTLLLVIFIVDVVLLIPVILMQSGSGAEAGMFGSSLTLGAFGAKSSEVLVNLTKWLAAIFMIAAFLLGYIKIREAKQYSNEANTEQVTTQETVAPVDTNAVQPTTDSTLQTLPLNDTGAPIELPPIQ